MMRRQIIYLLLMLVSVAMARGEDRSPRTDAAGFSWRASFNSSVDMSRNDMSAVGFDGFFGMRLPRVQMLGIGATLGIPVNNSNRVIPVYVIFQSDFSKSKRLCFLDARAGFSVNYLSYGGHDSDYSQTGAYASAGLGINLAESKSFQSFMTIGYSFFERHNATVHGEKVFADDLHMVTLRLGVRF